MEKLCNIFGFLGLMVAGQCVFGAIVPSLYDESSGKTDRGGRTSNSTI